MLRGIETERKSLLDSLCEILKLCISMILWWEHTLWGNYFLCGSWLIINNFWNN